MLATILRAFLNREWPALAVGAFLVAAATAWPSYHLGVTAGIGTAVEIRDTNRVMHSVCYDVLDRAERTATLSVLAQETLKAMRAEKSEVAEAKGLEVDGS